MCAPLKKEFFMVIVLLADGFEEIEALTPVDVLRRVGLDVKTVGMNGKIVCGSHSIPVICDLVPEEVELSAVSLAIFPGGMPGAENLNSHPFTDKVIEAVTRNGGRLAAICAAPLVFGRRGLLAGKRATCYPGFEGELVGALLEDRGVVTDGNITTAKGMGVSLKFAEELVALTLGEERARDISVAVMQESPYERANEDVRSFSAKDEEDIKEISETAEKITSFFEKKKIDVNISSIDRGHLVTSFGLEARDGSSKVIADSLDELSEQFGKQVRIFENLSGDFTVEIPHESPENVYLHDCISCYEFVNAPSPYTVIMGMDAARTPVFADAKRGGGIIVGGGDKDTRISFLHNIIISISKKSTKSEAKFAIFGKRFSSLSGLSDLYGEIETSDKGKTGLLEKIASWRADEEADKLFVIFDTSDIDKETVDLIIKESKKRGIYLLISVDEKYARSGADTLSSIGCRVCFKTEEKKYSEKIVGVPDATLLIRGADMLLQVMGAKNPIRVTAPICSSGKSE